MPDRVGDLVGGSKSELVSRLNRAPTRGRVPKLEGDEAKLMTGVFTRMKSIYGHLWSSNFRDEDQLTIAKLDWLGAFKRHGFTLGDVNLALDHCADNVPDMPNLPTFVQIVSNCRELAKRREAAKRAGPALPMSPEQYEAMQETRRQERLKVRDRNLSEIAAIQALFEEN